VGRPRGRESVLGLVSNGADSCWSVSRSYGMIVPAWKTAQRPSETLR
jgi:hypothetical protein